MIKPTRKERVLRWLAHPIAAAAYDTLCKHNELWSVGANRLFTKDHKTIIEFGPKLTNFTFIQPFRNRFGFFGSLLFRSVVTRIRLSHIATKLK
jgi:hypothetical protein